MIQEIILKTHLPLSFLKRGKVRDIYDLGEKLLIVSTDRISAFDVVLPNGIPCKGEALNRLSAYWFDETRDIIKNHVLEVVDPRTVLVRRTQPISVEFVVRGYLYGLAWKSYQRGRSICGVTLPKGLKKAEKLPNPILTPTTKAEQGHDIEMTFKEAEMKVGKKLVKEVADICMRIYERASAKAEANGIIVADTKMEFGLLDNELVLIDELLTPDSSRFWPKMKYAIGKS
ncbi:MAG: phosphoribosylaminoimidazolesuccinocarboxamide synthase, partial [Candidatus Bathyarchaeota archaeon]